MSINEHHVTKLFKYQGKWIEVSQDEYLKNWHDKIKSANIILDSIISTDGVKPDQVVM